MRLCRKAEAPPPNPALQLTASRARSLIFGKPYSARSRQLNANPFGGVIKALHYSQQIFSFCTSLHHHD
jgi:hypothetical protein